MSEFATDEFGNRTFTFNEWTVKVWSHVDHICVETTRAGVQVEISNEGIWVLGESSGFWEGPTPEAFTIPWEVINAILEAKKLLLLRESKIDQ